MKHIKILIPTEAVPKARARVVVSSQGRPYAYTPAKTREYEEYLRWLFKSECPVPFEQGVPLRVELACYLKKPKRNKNEYPVGRPDWDNLAKTLDAANGILWHDDSQIVTALMRKLWADKEGYSKLIVEVVRNETHQEEGKMSNMSYTLIWTGPERPESSQQ